MKIRLEHFHASALVIVTAVAAACGASADEAGGVGAAGDGFGGADGDGFGTSATSGAGGDGAIPPPPEEELESTFGAPVATGKFVWIANPASGRVAYIDAATLQIKLVEAGNAPTFIAAVPHPTDDVAIVLNVLSEDATVLRATGSTIEALQLPVPSSGNGWAMSPDGRWAIAWTDARNIKNADPIDGYQEISVLDLQKGKESSTELTVGYRPVALAFDAASEQAFAVTQDGVTVVSLEDDGASKVVKNVALSDDPASEMGTRDVGITPDGAYALVRRDNVATVGVFSLADGTRTDVVLPGAVTDLDLTADGNQGVAVVRETGDVALLPIPGIVTDPLAFPLIHIDDAIIGSTALATNSATAFLYTNAVPSPFLTVVDTAAVSPQPRTILLRAPVKAVFPVADAAHAIVLHDTPPMGDGSSAYVAAFSVAPIALELPAKIVGLKAPPISVAISPAGDRALIASGSEATGIYALHVASMPSLKISTFTLASQPISAGIVAGVGKGFVAQKHPDGRITFVDFKSGEVRTITGFELATQVVDGMGGTP